MASGWGKGYVRKYRLRFRAEIMFDGRRMSKTFEKEADAHKWLEVIKADAVRGVLGIETSPDLLFVDLCRMYIEHKTPRWRPATLDFHTSHLKGILLPAFGPRAIATLKPLELQRFIDARARVVAPRTANISHGMLAAVFRYAERMGLLKKSPMRAVDPVRVVDTFEGRALRLHEARALLQKCRPEDRPFFTILLFTGLRRSELFRMTWDWVNLCDEVLHVRIGKCGSADLPMAAPVVEAFTALGPRPDGLVFPGRTRGGQVNDTKPMNNKRKVILSGLEMAKIDPAGVGMHTFRRTFLTLLEETGAPYGVVRKLARHGKRPSDITGLYLKPSDEQLRAALARLADALTPPANVIQLRPAAA